MSRRLTSVETVLLVNALHIAAQVWASDASKHDKLGNALLAETFNGYTARARRLLNEVIHDYAQVTVQS
jgi:hypothetical protein